jgi:hypothetical protein
MHDPRVGRFFAIDPLTAKYPHNSPYAFSENRVIDAIELEGAENILIRYVWDKNRKAYLKTLEMGLGLRLFQSGIKIEYYKGPYVKKGFDYRSIYTPNKYSLIQPYDVQVKDVKRALKELKVFQEVKNKAVLLSYKKAIKSKYVGAEFKANLVVHETSLRVVRENNDLNTYYTKSNIKPKVEVEGSLILLQQAKIGAKFDTNGNKTSRVSIFDFFNIETKVDKDNKLVHEDIYFLMKAENIFERKLKGAGITNYITYKFGVTRRKATVQQTDENIQNLNETKIENP